MSYQISEEDSIRCQKALEAIDKVLAALPKAVVENRDLISQEQVPVLTDAADTLVRASEDSFIPMLKTMKESLNNTIEAYNRTLKVGGVR